MALFVMIFAILAFFTSQSESLVQIGTFLSII